MSLTTEGIHAEKLARDWLIKRGKTNIQQIDWLVKHENKYFAIEVKHRELFSPPPFYGTGLDIRQINLRKQLYDDLKIDTLIVVFEKETDNIYFQFLSKLETTEYHETKNGIRIYNIENYYKETLDKTTKTVYNV